MSSIAAVLSRLAAAGVFFFAAAAHSVWAQNAPTQGSSAAVDPAFEAGKRAFEALTEAERRALQDALVWTGDFNGTVGGGYGRATHAAIAAYAKRAGSPAEGGLDPKGRAALIGAADAAKVRLGFAAVRDPRTGASFGLPLKILVRRADTAAGSRWSAADDAVAFESAQSKESDGALPAMFDKLKDSSPARRVTYKLLRPDFFVVSGEAGGATFYTRAARGTVNGAAMLRGYTLTYPAGAKGNDRVSIAIANAFDPFPGAPAAAAAPGVAAVPLPPRLPPAAPAAPRAVTAASGIAVSADRVLTVLARCAEPKISARPARIVKQDEASGLMLLEAQGLNARALAPAAAGPAANISVVVLYQGAETMTAPGEILGAAAAGGPARVLAPLQGAAAGGAVFDRSGALVALAAPLKAPVRVAGVVSQAAWPLVEAPALSAFLAANGVAVKPAAAAGAPQSAADIAASARGALYPVVCSM